MNYFEINGEIVDIGDSIICRDNIDYISKLNLEKGVEYIVFDLEQASLHGRGLVTIEIKGVMTKYDIGHFGTLIKKYNLKNNEIIYI